MINEIKERVFKFYDELNTYRGEEIKGAPRNRAYWCIDERRVVYTGQQIYYEFDEVHYLGPDYEFDEVHYPGPDYEYLGPLGPLPEIVEGNDE